MPVYAFPVSGTIRIVAESMEEAQESMEKRNGAALHFGRAWLLGDASGHDKFSLCIEDFRVESASPGRKPWWKGWGRMSRGDQG